MRSTVKAVTVRKAAQRNVVLITLVAISGAWLLPSPGAACTCRGLPGPTETFDGSRAVFIATVAEICDYPPWYYRLLELIDQRFDTGLIWQVDEPLVHLEVEASWKSVTAARAVTHTSRNGGGCGYHFVEGHQYLIYAVERQGLLVTGLCSGTKKVANAGDDLDILAGYPQLPQLEAEPLPPLSRVTQCWSHWKGWWLPFARWAGF